jgi:hypothetical protein
LGFGSHDVRIGCVDFVSNTFFPATAAEELGCFSAEGVEAHVELLRTLVAFPCGTRSARPRSK